MRAISIIVAMLLMPFIARADETKLTIAQCLNVGQALVAIDKFKLGSERFPMSQNLKAVIGLSDDVQSARKSIIGELSLKPEDAEKSPDFLTKMDEVLNRPCPITFAKIKLKQIAGENEVPFPVILALDPLDDK